MNASGALYTGALPEPRRAQVRIGPHASYQDCHMLSSASRRRSLFSYQEYHMLSSSSRCRPLFLPGLPHVVLVE